MPDLDPSELPMRTAKPSDDPVANEDSFIEAMRGAEAAKEAR